MDICIKEQTLVCEAMKLFILQEMEAWKHLILPATLLPWVSWTVVEEGHWSLAPGSLQTFRFKSPSQS
jgi:hypothetical protein